jgi:hypothetical protein
LTLKFRKSQLNIQWVFSVIFNIETYYPLGIMAKIKFSAETSPKAEL